jgi:hypothetical protein
MLRPFLVGIASATVLWGHIACAHHSYSEYNDQETVEFAGKLVDVAWQNPHVRFMVEAKDDKDRVVVWDVESTSVNSLHRMQVPLDILRVGGSAKFAGWPSRRAGNRIYATNLQAPDGREVVLWRYSTPRWTTAALGVGSEEAAPRFQGGVASDTDSLFRVWATDVTDVAAIAAWFSTPLALTDAAQKALREFNPVNDTATPECTPKGMPIIMFQPPPMEFVDQGDRILLRTEEYDTVRTIHMTAQGDPEAQPKSHVGFSIGRWEGKTLVVETSRVNARYLNARGVPLGPSARFVERFTPAADGSRLDYALSITDPDSLTASAQMKRQWVWRPGERVLPFSCGERVTPAN